MSNAFLLISFCRGLWSLCKMVKAHSQAILALWQSQNLWIKDFKASRLQKGHIMAMSLLILACQTLITIAWCQTIQIKLTFFFNLVFTRTSFHLKFNGLGTIGDHFFCNFPINLHSIVQHFLAFLKCELKQFIVESSHTHLLRWDQWLFHGALGKIFSLSPLR